MGEIGNVGLLVGDFGWSDLISFFFFIWLSMWLCGFIFKCEWNGLWYF